MEIPLTIEGNHEDYMKQKMKKRTNFFREIINKIKSYFYFKFFKGG